MGGRKARLLFFSLRGSAHVRRKDSKISAGRGRKGGGPERACALTFPFFRRMEGIGREAHLELFCQLRLGHAHLVRLAWAGPIRRPAKLLPKGATYKFCFFNLFFKKKLQLRMRIFDRRS